MSESAPPSPERTERDFIELVTRPLEAQPEARDEARGELMARLSQARAPGSDAKVESALYRLAKVLPERWVPKGLLLSGLALLLLAALAALQLRAYWPEVELMGTAMGYQNSTQKWLKRLPDKDRVSMYSGFRDLRYLPEAYQANPVSNLEQLHREHPDDPAIFEIYALRHLQWYYKVPPNYRETWQKIDPDNGIWNLWEVMMGMRHKGTASYDPDLFGKAPLPKRFETYLPEMRSRSIAMLPEMPETYIGNAALLNLAESFQDNPTDLLLEVGQFLALTFQEAMECGKTRDQARFQALIAKWRKISLDLISQCQSYREFHSKLRLIDAGMTLQGHAKHLNLAEEEKQIAQLLRDLDQIVPRNERAGKKYGFKTNPPPTLDFSTASSLASARGSRTHVQDSPEDYRPGRLSEYAAVERFLSLAIALLLLPILALVWLESFRRGARANGIADGLDPLFTWKDRLWVIGLGCLAPVLWYLALTRWTPLGCRDIGEPHPHVLVAPSIRMGASFLLAGVLLLQASRWRIRRHLAFLGLESGRQSPGWIVAGIAALILPLAGAARWVPLANRDEYLMGVAAACGVPMLWLLWQAGAMLFAPGSGSLRGVLQSRRLLLPLAVLCGLMLALQPLLMSIERHWLSLDEVTRVDRNKGCIPAGEARKVEEIARRLAAVLNDAE